VSNLKWNLSTSGDMDQIKAFINATDIKQELRGSGEDLIRRDWLAQIPGPYDWRDVAPFAPSGAVYFMDGYSDARIQVLESEEEFFLQFWDQNTSISASAPQVFERGSLERELYTPVPPPLKSWSRFPENTPDRY